jgi:hypothetical protein
MAGESGVYLAGQISRQSGIQHLIWFYIYGLRALMLGLGQHMF